MNIYRNLKESHLNDEVLVVWSLCVILTEDLCRLFSAVMEGTTRWTQKLDLSGPQCIWPSQKFGRHETK